MKQKLIIFVLINILILPALYANAGTILSAYKHAWGSNVGYINFENVIVSDTTLSGYAWSENTGWIKFDPSQGGVLNDGQGNLSGSAWGEGLGWIDFENVSISTTTGRFSGTAVGDDVGTINFDCPNYCDVRTDWSVAPVVTPPPAPTQTNSGSRSSSRLNTDIPLHVESVNNPLTILPQQSGNLQETTNSGLVTLDVPANNVYDKTTFIIEEDKLSPSNNILLTNISDELVNGSFYDIYAIDQNGNPVHYFSRPIKITLPIAENQRSLKNLELYWLNETNWKWVLIPDAVFANDKVTFYVNHLTKFAIFADIENNSKIKSSISLPQEKKFEYEKNKEIGNGDQSKKTTSAKKNYNLWILLILIIFTIFLTRKNIKLD